MKKIILLCMALALLLTALSACGQQPQETQTIPAQTVTAETTPAVSQADKEVLLQNWEALLKVPEGLDRYMRWTLDYLDAFNADNSWDSLLKARVACLATALAFENSPLPEYTLTDEQYEVLLGGGIDAEMVKTEYLVIEESVRENHITLHSLNLLLHEDVFYTAMASELDTWSETHRALLAYTAEYYCYATNYLLLQLDMPEAWEQMPEKYPCLFSHASAWLADEDAIMAAVAMVLEQQEAQLLKLNDFIGRSEYTLELVKEALETANLEYLAKEIHTVEGVPCYIPIADWLLEDVDYNYLMTDPDTDQKVIARCGEEIRSAPSAFYVECAGITLEEVEQYAQQLAYWGIPVNAGWAAEAEAYHVFAVYGDTKLLVEWTAESTIYYMSGSLGCLATELHLLAISAE